MFLLLGILLSNCGQKLDNKVEEKQEIEIKKEERTYPDWINEEYVMGKFDPAQNMSFQKLPEHYCDRPNLYLRKEVFEAYRKMESDAKKAGIKLTIRSATRNFDYQKRIWESKWNGRTLLEGIKNASVHYEEHAERSSAIMRYCAMPGCSRHHWGTDIDLNAFTNSYFESGEGKKVFDWLEANASNYGFCRPYTQLGSDRDSGYQEEKWHWSYHPTSVDITHYAKTFMTDSLIEGFSGSETAKSLNVTNNYILGISKDCY